MPITTWKDLKILYNATKTCIPHCSKIRPINSFQGPSASSAIRPQWQLQGPYRMFTGRCEPLSERKVKWVQCIIFPTSQTSGTSFSSVNGYRTLRYGEVLPRIIGTIILLYFAEWISFVMACHRPSMARDGRHTLWSMISIRRA